MAVGQWLWVNGGWSMAAGPWLGWYELRRMIEQRVATIGSAWCSNSVLDSTPPILHNSLGCTRLPPLLLRALVPDSCCADLLVCVVLDYCDAVEHGPRDIVAGGSQLRPGSTRLHVATVGRRRG